MGIERATDDIIAVAPDIAQHVIALLRVVRAFAEEQQQFELGGSQLHGLVIDVKLQGVFVEAERTDGEIRGARVDLHALEYRLHT